MRALMLKLLFIGILLIFVSVFFSSPAAGELIFNASLGAVYEDNITGSFEDIDKQSDTYGVVSASVGGYTGIGKDTLSQDTFIFVRADFQNYTYSDNTDLDALVLGLNAGVYKKISQDWTAQGTVSVRRKEFRDDRRTSTAAALILDLSQKVASGLTLSERYELERNSAEDDFFTYTSHTLGIWATKDLSESLSLNGGYTFRTEGYDEPDDFRNYFHTFSAGLRIRILEKVYAQGMYSFQLIDSNVSGTGNDNNIVAVSIGYDYR